MIHVWSPVSLSAETRQDKFGVVCYHPSEAGPNPTQDTPNTPDGSGLPFDATVGWFECIVADGGRGDAGGDTG